ncbi:uncharacterized protein LOC130791869 [Actinidia eriantha]|uniref:uncharacterized protein LOC130791869 n=1 Tax=Actinidia eriantha TaxID=165200 RepID=UPI00258E1B81|nr:uncharacterized protein LOC130791869 [Actinidia eriantha]
MEATLDPPTPSTLSEPTTPTNHEDLESLKKAQTAIQALSPILSHSLPPSLSSARNPAFSLLHHPDVASQITTLLHHPDSGAGDNPLCRWLYDTFQSSDPGLQLVVLRFLPTLAGVYLSRVALRKPLAGFEAVILALYAHETASRGGQAATVNIPDLSHSSIYHETTKSTSKNASTELNLAVISPSLEPHGTVRSTRRARIIGVALELYFSKISQMPVSSKVEFCEFCVVWAGQDGDVYRDDDDGEIKREKKEERESGGGRIPLPWELLQPVLRILGHCLMGPCINKEEDKRVKDVACGACRSLYARAMHDVSPKAILATRSLLRLGKMASNLNDDFDPTELPADNVLSL